MKLVTFKNSETGAPRLGVLVRDGAGILDLQSAYISQNNAPHAGLASMQDLIEAGEEGLMVARALIADADAKCDVESVSNVQLLAPLPQPVQMRDALTFRAHLADTASDFSAQQHAMLNLFFTRPFWYKCNRLSVVGPDVDVVWPHYSTVMDYEHELAMVIGKTGRAITREDAPKHIFGYTIFNDLSARDVQAPEMSALGPARSKDFDGGNILGPCIVTADEFDPTDAVMTLRINGAVLNTGNSGTMHFSFPDLIAFISEGETLHAGEIIASGTVGGGCGAENGRLLASGDLVELEVAGIGILRNRIFSAR